MRIRWKGIHVDLTHKYEHLSPAEKSGGKGAQLRAMITAATLPRDVAAAYAKLCRSLAQQEKEPIRQEELLQMAQNLDQVPWQPPKTLWIRTPVIPGMTSRENNILGIGGFISKNLGDVVSRWELCAFNNLCKDKYLRLGQDWALRDELLLKKNPWNSLPG